ncbi:MAG TPA: translation initiation factor IF-3 [Hellea balneolensis]|uniref:Translation initiation factor IF-3 n=1 Tax=Hellea balneolensis TaxID=287478 RepID=A0A7C5M0T7_9PROT|nr:translation initiation factor IF-3 [Hellea balneolensis]
MARRPLAAPPKKKGPRINDDITSPKVLLITETGEKRGVVSLEDALETARRAGLDLVEVAPNPDMPVCKILDYGKMRFEAQKKKAANKKRQKTQDIKEIKMRPNIDTHDYMVKTKAMTKFFERGDKVKVTIRFRGREMAHMDRGRDLLDRVKEDFEEIAKIEFEPKTEGRLMTMVMAPK